MIARVQRSGSVRLRAVTPAAVASGLAIYRGLGRRPTSWVRHGAGDA
ncbi:MAG TPA: hypothetical protein VF069_13715 [Streptosporangiaceae bacterium]